MTENHQPEAARTDDVQAQQPQPVQPRPIQQPVDQPTQPVPAAAAPSPAAPAPWTAPAPAGAQAPVTAAQPAVAQPAVAQASPPAQPIAAAQPAPTAQPAPIPAAFAGSNAPSTGSGPLEAWTQESRESRDPRRPRWFPIAGTAAGAALLASVATAGLTGAFATDQESATNPASIATIGQTSSETVPVAGSTSDDPDWEQVSAAVSASVVAIQVTTANGGGEGSGVVIDEAGHILTNNHVVAGAADDTVQVTLTDGRLYDATIVGLDPSTDLAVIKIVDAPDDLAPATLGDSDEVTVGSPVMAVGNPLGLANTVTTGIVSAVDRPVSASSSQRTSGGEVVVTNAIQIDAAINPGNSGGPMFDAQGRVIGITSSIATISNGGASGSIGLGFAIPVNLAREVGQQLIESGTAEHAFLGVSLSDGTATADGITRRGAVVEQVTDGSPAQSAELQTGDVIVAIDGDAVGGAESLTAYVRERQSGDQAELTLVRDGEALEVTVTLATRETSVVTEDSGSDGSGSSQDGSQLPHPDGSEIPGFEWFGGRG